MIFRGLSIWFILGLSFGVFSTVSILGITILFGVSSANVVLRDDICGFSVCDEFDWTQTGTLWNTESEGSGGDVEVNCCCARQHYAKRAYAIAIPSRPSVCPSVGHG